MPNNNKKVQKDAYWWTRWAWDEHAADTAHLSLLEEGVYMRLLRLYYRDYRGPLSDDVTLLARKVGARSDEERKAVEVLLGEFFQKGTDGLWHHTRCDAELASIKVDREKKVQAGKDGAAHRQRDEKGRLVSQQVLDREPAHAGEPSSIVRDRARDTSTPTFKSTPTTTTKVPSLLEEEEGTSAVDVVVPAPPKANPDKVGADMQCSTPNAERCAGNASASEAEHVKAWLRNRSDPNWGVAPSEEERERAEIRRKMADGSLYASPDEAVELARQISTRG